ncbi:unnamed protein product [Didymodactylos carnosus]|uniref:Uncharacterized protein n=1 Tax=Didymodactylos carnosus TaxID=1234261 RepID=A0A815R054_9BILA|nr:unnamed protein product [Didymodactylos carnosus]CAF4338184.1 unnamed protein product [Didymodactylos carnosus]
MADKGFKKEMDQLHVECTNCEWVGKLKGYQDHLDECHSNYVCELCGEKFSTTSTLNSHKYICQNVIEPCPLVNHGCSDKIVRSKLTSHYLTESHQHCLLSFLLKFHDLIQSWLKANTNNTSDMNSTSIAGSIHYKLHANVDSRANDIETQKSANALYSELRKCYETLTILTQGIQTLSLDTNRLSSESLNNNTVIQSLFSEISQAKILMDEKHSHIAVVGPDQERLQQELLSVKEKLDSIEFTSHDGTLVWKVINVSEKMADAQSERHPSIYSPIFYSSPCGYKMRARLYLFGDGNGRRTHMSLFFVLMRGEYDSILKWPFHHKVTFCLFDQSGQNRHVIDSFKPDTKSNSFQRPRSELNIASGIPKFFPLPMIQQDGNNYVRDNTMFIKVIVDLADVPKMILPFTLSLNPGLPVHVQHHLIQQETQKQQASTSSPDVA